jgi:flagellar biosynthesis anti-sigma factor FlgM
VLGEDQAQLSGIHLQVRALVGQTLELPEVQQEKVQSLRHAINDGTYQPRAEDVAGAMFSNLAGMLAA